MKELTIGKLPDNHIVIEDPKVSRHHAKITMDSEGRYEITDLKSTNGTYVNGRKVKGSLAVKPGDKIVIATTLLKGDWAMVFDHIEDDKPVIEHEPAAPVVQRPVAPTSVLYDFGKDSNAIFSERAERLRAIITNFTATQMPQRRRSVIRRFSEDTLDLLVERYDYVSARIAALLKTLEDEGNALQADFEADMKKLDVTYQYRLSNSSDEGELEAGLDEVDRRRKELRRHYEETRKELLPKINTIIDDYYADNPPLFTDRMELAPAGSELFKEPATQDDGIQKTFVIGEAVNHYTILREPIELRQRVYVRSLYDSHLLFLYNERQRQTCFDVVNTLIGRMLAATPSGNVHVVMVDFNEMEGTCDTFKGLNKEVFCVVSRYDEFLNMLNAESLRAAGIIQNLLHGDIDNIAEYNCGKSEKVPFTLIILKDIPIGFNNDLGTRLSKIARGGQRAGVSVMALVNAEEAERSNETNKAYTQLQNVMDASTCETYSFITTAEQEQEARTTANYDVFEPRTLSAIVKKVNKGLEVKTERILPFEEYMLPKHEWWKGQSANRIDLPFGITKDMKTTTLQITQESGQNTAVVIGIPGSGKSVFLHTIIASAITNYSPSELQIYLLDFSGVEFNVYATHKLPHASVIAPEAEREFGLSILREVFEEGNRRMALCREKGVTNIVELKRDNPELVVPRLLVVIDEFQKIFEVENDIISREANAKIHAIIQEYRKFGINLILATQKLPNKGILPYDLIANRIVFKSDPNDFNNLIKWPHTTPMPRLLTGMCVYNNESGAEVANSTVRSYYINASKELETLLDEVKALGEAHPEMTDRHALRIFRSNELPVFNKRIVAERHNTPQETPREVGVYVGESIAIAESHVYAPLTKDSSNNILIIGGETKVAKGIALHALASQVAAHSENTCNVILMNFMTADDPLQALFKSDMFESVKERCNLKEVCSPDSVVNMLKAVKNEIIDVRKKDASAPMRHVYINIIEFQRGQMFDGVGGRGDMQSESTQLLEYILKNGPMVGVFTVLQVDNLTNLCKINYNAQSLFCHRIALQMPERDSDKVVGSGAANRLLVLNRPTSVYRGLYYNYVNNTITKFKPYKTQY